jgi:hypothetical protein
MNARRKTCRYHCRGGGGHRGCSTHFSSLEAFDLHRRFDEAGRRVCVPPPAVVDGNGAQLLKRQTDAGTCRICSPGSEGITIWTSVHSERAAQVFRGRSALGPKPETPSEAITGVEG